jgi:hypothetical protein
MEHAAWLEERIDKSGGASACWLFISKNNKSGYRRIKIKGKLFYAHRLVYSLSKGIDIPSHIFVCHHCDNPSCCNPDHLFLGNHADNMRDCSKKVRLHYQKKRKLSAHQVSDARLLYSQGESITSLALLYFVDRKTIRNILKRVTYKEVENAAS